MMDQPPDLESFLGRLGACGLFGPQQIQQFQADGHTSAAALADYLERNQFLTKWQRNRLWERSFDFHHSGGYVLLSELGQGAYGTCYLVSDRYTPGRKYALKELKPHWQQDPQKLQRFRREMKALQALSHKNIIGITRIGSGREPWFAMEFVGGHSLSKWAGHGRMSIPLACEICLQISTGLQA